MNYLQKKKLAFMSIVNRVKGFIRTITGALPLTLEGCVDEESIIDYTLYGQSVQNGTPTPDTPVEVESVGDKTANLCNPDEIVTNGRKENDYVYGNNVDIWVKAGTYTLTFDFGGTGGVDLYVRKGQVSSGYLAMFKTTNAKSIKYTFTFAEDEYLRISHFGSKENAYFYNFMLVAGTKSVTYEPYNKYKIPVKVSSNDKSIATNIYLDEPLGEGQSINYKKDGLPTIPTFKGTSIISTDTTIQPSNVEITYYSNVKE